MAVPLDTRYEQFYGGRPRRGGGLLNRGIPNRSKSREVNWTSPSVDVGNDGAMAPDWIRRCASWLLAFVALAAMPVTAQAHSDDANPLFDLVDAATQRLQTADPVAETKWINGGSIEDPPRV